MRHKNVGESQNEYLLTVPSVWTEGSSPMPGTHRITSWEAPINILLAQVFDKAKNVPEALPIDNALSTKALEVENSFADGDARVQQACTQRRPHQHWFGKWTKLLSAKLHRRPLIAEVIEH